MTEEYEDFDGFDEEQLEIIKRLLDEQKKIIERERFWSGDRSEDIESEIQEKENESKKKETQSQFSDSEIWSHSYKKRVGEIERKTGDIEWVYNNGGDVKSNKTLLGISQEIIEGYLDKKKIFEIKRGISMYNLTIFDDSLREEYRKKTSFRSHSSPEYEKLKEKALKIRNQFLKNE